MDKLFFADNPQQKFVRKTIIKFIDKHKTFPNEAKRSLIASHHMNLMVENLDQQIKDVQALQLSRNRMKIPEDTLIWFIDGFTEVFIKGFLGHIEKRQASEIKKYQMEHADDDIKDMQSTLEGNSVGVYEDMGLVIPEDQLEKPESSTN